MSELDLNAIERRANKQRATDEDLVDMVAEVRRLRTAVDAALALHVAGATNGGYRYCVTCESEENAQPYPCPTRRALDPVAKEMP